MSRSVLRLSLSLIATVGVLVACDNSDASPTRTFDSAWAADSARYEVEIVQWRKDSTLIDSLSRRINTDKLYHLGRALLTAKDPQSLMQSIVCEHFRLGWLHGIRPVEMALKRMSDTLYGYADGETLRRLSQVKGYPVMLAADEKVCGIPGREAPTEVNGILLSGSKRKPVEPKKGRAQVTGRNAPAE